MIDVVVVGSGASGVNAAYPLVEAGLSVTMLDVGNRDGTYAGMIPERPFSEIRRDCEDQHRFLLGDRFEGIPFGQVRVGAQLTPPRLHITEGIDKLMPVDSNTFSAMESLAVGGLAAGWGANVAPFLGKDFAGMPIGESDLRPHYEQVAQRIGVSGARDDLADYLGDCESMLPPLEIDAAGGAILERYERNRSRINACGLRLGQARLAACSQPHRGRGGHPHHDMDFWSDPQRSVYRPQWTLEELQHFPNFHYHPRCFVQRFREVGPQQVRIEAAHVEGGRAVSVDARSLILAAGTLSSARIVLR